MTNDTLDQDVALYLELCDRVPSYHPDHGRLYQAIRRGDTEHIRHLICRGTWLLACHVLAPSFKVAYGNPHLYRDFETGELTDVWQPVVADFLRRGK